MERNTPDEAKINVILDLITALDGRILKVEHDRGLLIVFADVTKAPVQEKPSSENCPCYDPSDDDDECEHCMHCCPECGRCMLNLDGEDC